MRGLTYEGLTYEEVTFSTIPHQVNIKLLNI